MKIRTILTMLSAVIAVAMMAVSAFSQNFSVARHMGAVLNTSAPENDPTLAPSGLSLYFTSNRTGGQGGNDIYVSGKRPETGIVWLF